MKQSRHLVEEVCRLPSVYHPIEAAVEHLIGGQAWEELPEPTVSPLRLSRLALFSSSISHPTSPPCPSSTFPAARRFLSDKYRLSRRRYLDSIARDLRIMADLQTLPPPPLAEPPLPPGIRDRASKSFRVPDFIYEEGPPIFVPGVVAAAEQAAQVQEQELQLFKSPPPVQQLATVGHLLRLVNNGDIDEFNRILLERRVFRSRELRLSFAAFSEFIVSKTPQATDAVISLKNLLSLEPTAAFPIIVLWSLLRRLCEENGPAVLRDEMQRIHAQLFPRARPSKGFKRKVAKERRQLYFAAWNKGDNANAVSLFEEMTRLLIDSDAQVFLHEAAHSLYANNSSFSMLFAEWEKLSSRYSTAAGSSAVWKALIREEETMSMPQLSKSIDKLLTQCQQFDHPFASLAELVCALLQLDRMDDAKQIMQKLPVSGRYFIPPLEDMARNDDLENIEKVAYMITFGIYGHKKRAPQRSKQAEEECEQEAEKPRSKLLQSLANFYGWDRKKKKFVDYSKGKKEKKKIHKVDEKQLHAVAVRIQELWQEVAERTNSTAGLQRLNEWAKANKLEPYESSKNSYTKN